MHVPDHFLDPATSVATAVAAGAVLVAAATRLRRAKSPAPTVLFDATTAAVFGLQMLNYPVTAGASGHMLGGALAAAVLGPLWGMFSITVVVVVQSLLFADGGLTALGTNVVLMAIVGVLVGWIVSKGVLGLAGKVTALAVAAASAVGALISVVAAAGAFIALFAVGGSVEVPLAVLAPQMLGVHLLIGAAEAAITGVLVAAIAVLAPGSLAISGGAAAPTFTSRVVLALGGLTVVASGMLSSVASTLPDGLEATAQAVGFEGAARDHLLAGLPLADYGAFGGLAVGRAGVVGLVVCGFVAFATARAVRPTSRHKRQERVVEGASSPGVPDRIPAPATIQSRI